MTVLFDENQIDLLWKIKLWATYDSYKFSKKEGDFNDLSNLFYNLKFKILAQFYSATKEKKKEETFTWSMGLPPSTKHSSVYSLINVFSSHIQLTKCFLLFRSFFFFLEHEETDDRFSRKILHIQVYFKVKKLWKFQ